MVSKLQFIRINLHKSTAAASVLSKRVTAENIEISLIQEPWTYRGRVGGLTMRQGQVHYCPSVDRPRASILTRGVRATSLGAFNERNLVAVKLEVPWRDKRGI